MNAHPWVKLSLFMCIIFIINAFYELLFRLWDWEDPTLKAVPWNDWVKSPLPRNSADTGSVHVKGGMAEEMCGKADAC